MTSKPVNFNILLGQLNDLRVAIEHKGEPLTEMPKGNMRDGALCPIARALSNGWSADVGDEITLTLRADDDEPFQYDHVALYKRMRAIPWMRGSNLHVDADKASNPDDDPNCVWSVEVSFTATATMQNFIYRFDTRGFEHLILTGEKPE